MSLEYTSRGPTTVGFSGQVTTPDGPLESDFTPLVVSDAIVVTETITIHFATRNLTVTDPVTVHDAISKDVTPISLSDHLTPTETVALALSDTITVTESTSVGPGQIGSTVFVQPFYPGTGAIASSIYTQIVYSPVDATGSSVWVQPFYTPQDAIGSSNAFKANLPTASASDTITVLDKVYVVLQVHDTLVVHESIGREWDLSVADAIDIVVDEVSSGPLVHDRLVPTERIGRIFELSVTDALTANDSLALGLHDALIVVERKGYERDVHDVIVVTETITVATSLHDVLVVTEQLIPVLSDDLVVVDSVHRVYPLTLSDSLMLIETLGGQAAFKAITDVLVVAEAIVPSNVYNRSLSDALTVSEGIMRVGTIVPGITGVCEEGYAPAVPLGTRTGVVLTWPYAAPSLTLKLRNPKFGNSDAVNTNTLFARTRSGQLSVVRDPTWPLIETLRVAFEALSEQQKLDFEDFIQVSAAFEIGYLDQEARQWRGYLTNASFETMQVGIECQFNLSFELRGRLA